MSHDGGPRPLDENGVKKRGETQEGGPELGTLEQGLAPRQAGQRAPAPLVLELFDFVGEVGVV